MGRNGTGIKNVDPRKIPIPYSAITPSFTIVAPDYYDLTPPKVASVVLDGTHSTWPSHNPLSQK